MAHRLVSSNSLIGKLWWLLVRPPWQSPGTLYLPLCYSQSPGQVSGRVVCKWGVQWFSGTSGFLWMSLCWVSGDIVSGCFGTGSVLTSTWGWCLSSRDLAWAWWPLPLHSSCVGQQYQSFMLLLFCLFGLLYFGQEDAWGILLVEPLLCLLPSFSLPELLHVCLCMLGMSPSPSLSWFLRSLGAPDTPQGRRSFNAICRDALSVPGPVGTAGSFCLGMVCEEGIASLRVLGSPVFSHSWELLL